MPCIKDESTVEAIARAFCGEGKRNKSQSMQTTGYTEAYANSGIGQKTVYGNIRVKAAIARIDAKTRAESVKSRKVRQEFWSDAMDNAPNWGDRLRASELLGRSEADFTDNINTGANDKPIPLTDNQHTAAKAAAKAATRPRLAKETG